MGYTNPLCAYGFDKIVSQSKEAGFLIFRRLFMSTGANGFIVVDLPAEESTEFRSYCTKYGMSYIPLIAPVTSNERMSYINSIAGISY